MNYGFNSEIRVGDEICHVQTEEYGPPRHMIETAAYCRGRIFHRRTDDYTELAAQPGFSQEALRLRVEEQHRGVVEGLRSGAIPIPPSALLASSASADGIQVKLRNANSWLARGHASLDVEVVRQASGEPVSEAHVEAHLEGAMQDTHFSAITGADGLAQFRFSLPPLGANGAELVIRASAGRHSDEIRYSLRPRQKSPAPGIKS
jgi:hypothetical protein